MNNPLKTPHELDKKMYEKVYASALKLLYSHTPEKTYITIVKEAVKLVGAKYGSIFLVENGEIVRAYSTIDTLKNITPRKRGNTWKAFSEQKPYILNYKKLYQLHPELANLAIGCDMGIPIAYNDKSFGVLSVMSHENILFTEKELYILQMFTPLASLAIRNTQLYSEVTRSLEEQDLFISMAAHELKTPLTAISIYAQLLLREDNSNKPNSTNFKQKMFHEIQRLSKLVNELLQVSQIKKGRLQFVMKKCDIGNVVESAVTNFQAGDTKHTFTYINKLTGNVAYIKGDSDKITQLVTNLLTNAAKFSPKGSPIDIVLSYTASQVSISVTDQGIGISKENITKIFESFYKVAQQKKEGLGIGLYLVKNIVDHHKGKIKVKSTLNKETIFTITLPLYHHNA